VLGPAEAARCRPPPEVLGLRLRAVKGQGQHRSGTEPLHLLLCRLLLLLVVVVVVVVVYIVEWKVVVVYIVKWKVVVVAAAAVLLLLLQNVVALSNFGSRW